MAVNQDNSTRVIDALRDPQLYDHPVDSVEVLQTHISWVVLAGEFAYRLKKPVYALSVCQPIRLDTSGVLLATLVEARKQLCERLQPAHFEVADV